MKFHARWVCHFSAVLILAVAVTAIVPATASARVVESKKYGVWTYQHFIGDIEWCGVKTNWPDSNMVLTIRLRRKRLDFFFFNEKWNLKRRQKTRDTVFEVGRHTFYAETETLDSNKAIFGTFRDQISTFVKRFKRARKMRIRFPTKQNIGVNLKGSSRAMDAAIRCWDRRLNY